MNPYLIYLILCILAVIGQHFRMYFDSEEHAFGIIAGTSLTVFLLWPILVLYTMIDWLRKQKILTKICYKKRGEKL